MQGDFRAARPLFEEAVEVYRNADDAAGTIEALRRLGWAVADDDLEDAERLVDEAGRVARQPGTIVSVARQRPCRSLFRRCAETS